jgi:hypothetical protein
VIVDLRRPTSMGGRFLLALSHHGALKDGVWELPPLLKEAGFAGTVTGPLPIGMLGYAIGEA